MNIPDFDRSESTDFAVPPAPQAEITAWREPPIREILSVLKRRRTLLIGIIVLITGLATIVGLSWPVNYTATALVMIEPREQKLVDMEQVVESWSANNASIDLLTAAMQTQIKVIEAEQTVEGAMDRLSLLDADRLIAEAREADEPRTFTALGYTLSLASARDWLAQFGLANDVQAHEQLEITPVHQLRTQAIDRTRQGLKVEILPRSYVISISYEASEPKVAAGLVNALVDTYLEEQREHKKEKTHLARRWLVERAGELQAELREIEGRVRNYRAETGLSAGTQSIELEQQQLADLTSQLIEARGARAAIEARLQRIEQLRSRPDAGNQLAEALSSVIITRLRQDRLDLLREYSQLSRDFGDRHPRMLELRAQQQGVEARIAAEIGNAIENLRGEAAVALGRERVLQEAIELARQDRAVSDRDSIELDELMRQADANRTLYQTFLNRAGEIAEQETLIQSDARVAQAAKTPTHPSSPSPLLFTLAGLVFSVGAGSVMVFLREQTDRRVRSAEQLRSTMRLATLGMIPRRRKSAGWSSSDLAKEDASAFAEAVRGVCTQLQLAMVERSTSADGRDRQAAILDTRLGRVVLVTSALPEEGKTSLSLALSIFGAPQLGRTLLIDCDLRRPNVARSLQLDLRRMDGRGRLREFDLKSAVRVGAADVLIDLAPHGNPAAAFASPEMMAMMAEAKRQYDWIIMDAPPALGLPDALLLSRHADTTIVATRWGRSVVGATRAAVSRLRQARAPRLTGVIGDVAMKQHGRYNYGDEAEYYRSYQRYYRN